MVGYTNDSDRALKEWYQLFKKQKRFFSIEDSKHWEYVIKFKLLNHKNKNWKYFPFEDFFKHHFVLGNNINISISKNNILNLPIDCYQIVFVNGKFSHELSNLNIDPWILKIDCSSNRYNIAKPIRPSMFLYLTECLSNALIHIKLPNKSITKKPLYLLHINLGSNTPNQLVTSHYYHYLEIGNNTNTSIIEHFVSLNNHKHFSGSRMLMSIGNRSQVNHIKLMFENQSSYHISYQDINLNQYSNLNSSVFVISGSKFTRHKISTRINHDQSSLSLNSLTILSKKNIGDIQTYLEHNNQNYSISRQLHKIISKNNSTGVFTGLIKVNKKSINTDAKMINNNLLLDQSSEIYSKPKLEIYSDSVQCSHGSTIGNIDPNYIFYLNTRGISKKNAIDMLIHAFIIEITKKIENSSLKIAIMNKINRALNGM